MENHDARPLDQETFLIGLGKLQRIYSPHDTPAATDALLAAYEDVFFSEGPHRPGLAWVTVGLFRRAVTCTLVHVEPSAAGIPAPKELVERCRELKAMDDRRRAAADQDLTRPALAVPQLREAEAVDPQDPYSCTPEERRRWAEQDAWIRPWARHLPERLPPCAPEWERDAWERNQRIAHWPALTPAARRAQEQRIAGERERAVAQIRAHQARGARLRAAHKAIVRQGHALGFPAGSVELRDYVQREYVQALAGDPPPAAGALGLGAP